MYKLTKPQKLIYDMERFAGGAIAVVCGSAIRNGHQDTVKLKATVNTLYRLNDALRTRIIEQNGEIKQTVVDFTEQDIEELYFANKDELNSYAENYATQPININSNLCEVKVVQLPEQYGFIIKVHHIIGDAWTLSLFASQFYAILDGETPVAYPYKEYADSEVAYLQSKRYEKDSAFFLEQFNKCDEVTYLSDKQTNSLISVRKTFEINCEKSRYIYRYAQEHHTSPFTLFATALSVYMNRVKMNAEKFYIGTAVLNRSGVREKNTMGMFINTVPMLIELNNEQTFLQNLKSVEASAFSALRHQKYNYGDVLEDIRKKYNFNERLYDVIISYQNAKITGNAESTWYHNGLQVESLQIHIDDRDSDGFFKFQYDYQTEKFTEQDIDRLHQNICNLLFDAIANDTKKLYELELLTSYERQKLLIDFNNTTVDYPRDKCIHTLFEEEVMKTPNKTAVIACDRTLTYDELNKQANRISHGLINRNIGKGDIVAIKLTRKSYLISAMFGVLKTAAAYMPLDPTYPQERIEYMLRNSNAKYIVDEENIFELLDNKNDNNPNVYVSFDDIFCALHTSGSTGEPKLSLLLHGGICNYIVASQDFYKNADTFVSSTITTFDAFQWESVLSISKGIALVLSSEDAIYNQADFEKLFLHSNRNMFFCPPAKLENYINNSLDIKFLSNIKSFIIGGEVFIDTLLEKIRTYSPDSTIFNAYGPTETTVICMKREVHEKGEETTLGKPMANIQIYIVDKYLKPVPIGVTGELCIAGDGVGAGYLNRPELTAEKFIDNPFGKGNLYKTGDLAYWRDDGNIVYIGRNDFQVKIRGLRIELGEIENAISAIDGIVQSVVIVRKDNTGRQIICAFYTGKEFTAKELREIIGQKLPKYMLPHIFTHLDEIPLTPSGKINRKSLPDIDLNQIITTTEYVEPENELEIRLAALMEKVLEYSPIGRNDDFFELGGDSLKAINLISNLEKIGYHTDIKTLFANPTVRTLVTKLTSATQQIVPIEEINGEVSATHAQMRVYTAQTIQGGTAYNVPFVFRVDTLNPEKLQKAIQTLVDRYEIFRTHFEEQNGHIVQIIEQKIVFNVEKLENDDISAFIRPFDLTKAPLLRVGYYGNTIMIDFHHIIIDGGSLPIFFRELNELYMGRDLKEPVIQYRQFSAQPSNYSDSETYWLSVYSDELPELELNTDYKRTQKFDYNGNALYASIDYKFHKKIIETSRKLGITPFVFYMSGFYILLSKFSGNEDIIVGMPVSGRRGTNLQALGMFVNTLALRGKPARTKQVSEFLTEIKYIVIDALTYQNYPYGELIKKLNINTPNRNPLFDVMFAYQDEAVMDIILGDKKVEVLPIPITTSKYDFTFNIIPKQDNVVIMAEYCSDLYKGNTIQRFIDGYRLILEQMLDSDKLIKDISVINEQECQKLLIDFNNTTVDYPRDKCIHTLFEEQVIKTPYKTAVIAYDRTLTYDELNKQANSIAHELITRNIGKGDIVAIKLTRKSYLISAMLGVLKTAAAYMPLDPTYPQERIEYMLHESNAKYLVDEENISELLKNKNDNNPNIYVSYDDVFCALHTSGSTGKPKLSLLLHGSMNNFIIANKRFWKGIDTVVSTTIVTFDAFQMDTILSVAQGVQLVLSDENEIYSQNDFEKLFLYSKSNMFFSTPTKIENYINNSINFLYLGRIKSFIIGGEIFNESLLEKITSYSPESSIFNIYGPTETTICVLVDSLDKTTKEITLGKPISNTRIYIVDKYLKPVPIGVTGELCIAGNGVGAGYLNRPELTAEKFIDNPFGKGKLYRTGDLAYWRDDGNIVYIGRNDFQVKIRGLRIELGEIENAISAIDGIVQSVVLVRKDNAGRQIICAFYTGKELHAKKIREIIGQKLPKYMLPHIFTHLDEMPLTPSGKINRKSLPDVDLNQIITTTEYVEPENELEIRLAALMEKVLEYSPIGRDDDFFELGGDSLKAINLISNLEKIGYHTDIKTLFANPTVRTLVTKLTSATQQIVPIEEINGEVSATHAQMRVYTAQKIQGGTAYNVPFVFRVDTLNPEKLQKAIQALVDCYEIFRTHFEEQNGRIVQIVEQKIVFNVEKLESDDISAFIRPFDLTKAPLMRVGYYGNTIMIDIHHIIIDGGSLPIFFRELNELYMDRKLKIPIVQYRQIATQPRDYFYSEDYWLNVYADEIPELELNTDYKRGNKLSHNGSALYASLDLALHQNIITISRKLGITPFIFYMGAFYILLSKFSGNEDIIVGIPVNGRKGTNLDVIGMFVNTVALRGKPIGTRQINEFLTEGRYKTFDAIINQDYPYGELIKKLNINTPNRNPLFDVMFAYQDKAISEVVFADKSTEVLPIPVTISKYDFTFNIIPRQDNVVIIVEYCTDLYKKKTIQRFIDGYRLILEQMLDSDKLIKDISVIDEQERQKLLFDFNNTTVDYPRDKCVHTLFEEQVMKTPDKTAVIACDKTLTYDELNKQANRIAHSLIDKGIKVGDIVAFALPRTSNLIVSMLGILKAGAVYLPIDTDYPQDRVDYILWDSRAKVCITDKNIESLLKNDKINNPSIAISNDNLCYCIYTSGSTGMPKGTLLKHRGIVNLITNIDTYHDLLCCERIGLTTTITFDVASQEIFTALLNGFLGVLLPERRETTPDEIIKYIIKYKIDVIYATTTYFDALTDTDEKAQTILNSIKIVALAGEKFALNTHVIKYKKSYNVMFENHYGPAETHVVSTTKIKDSDLDSITIGKPIANTQIYIIDKYLKPVPIGVTGELCVAGDGVGAGYLNRPELTAEKFIDNPFGKGKLYRTGDLAYWRDDGNIVYVGRNDFQIKIRGLRIELGEIENAISAIDGILQSVVIVRKDNTGRQIICAFYTGKEFTAKELREIIGQKLPKYMLPHIFTHLYEMPLTPSGKISRKSLPSVDFSQIITATEYIEPENELEIRLATLMEKVLEYSPIGRDDDFFELGCDSLKAIMFTSIAHNDGINFNLQNVFDYPTVQQLAKYINDENKQQISYDNFDFTEINKILAKNKIENIQTPQAVPVSNILVAGATGFLGAHILSDYLEHDNGVAYCLVRGKNQADSKKRLKKRLNFYFGKKYDNCERIQVICADLQEERFGLSKLDYKNLLSYVDTVINAAATVKHYGSYSYFHSVNVETVTRLIDFCVSADAKLIHISTEGVSGNDSDNVRYDNVRSKVFYASDLYIGQNLENVYALSKFEAEIAVLKAMNKGLRANIMRMGNLTNRYSDGMFQINYETNAFLKRFKAFLSLGMIPDYLLGRYVEFTPIDEAAHAVMTITRHFSNEQTVFHLENYKRLLLEDLIVILKKIGYEINSVEEAVFTKALLQTIKQREIKYIFEAFINDMDANNRLTFSNLHIDTDFTVQYLKRLGFEWSEIDLEYLKKYMEYFRKLRY